MFKIFQKKERYAQTSSKFKTHFDNRDIKVCQVKSNDVNIYQKLKIFKQLINDNSSLNNDKKSIVSLQYFQPRKKIKAKKPLQEDQINELMEMSEGFTEWNHIKHNKKKNDQNIFNWDHYKEEKKYRKKMQTVDMNQLLKQKMNLTLLKKNHSIEKLQKISDTKIYHGRFNSQGKQFHKTLREDNRFHQQQQLNTKRRKFKLAKYYGEMNDFRCYRSNYSQNNSIIQNSRIMSLKYPIQSKSGIVTPFSLDISFKKAQIQRKIILKDIFHQQNAFDDSQILRASEMSFSKQCKCEKNHCKCEKKLKNQNLDRQKLKSIPSEIVNQMSSKMGKSCSQKWNTEINVKKQINTNKLNAIKKIKCL